MMLSKKFQKTVKDIKALKIQGAESVRKAAVEALLDEVNSFNGSSALHFKADLLKASKELINSRPTEPELRTALRIVLHTAQSNSHSLFDLKKEVKNSLAYFEKQRNEALRKITIYGAREIPNNAIVLTHCHSHTVMGILKEAHRQGKIARVICTESRPLFQGRKTAEELAKAGIKTSMIVDSAVSAFVKECALFLSGADAVLSDGSVVNKIGTQNCSLLAEKYGVPHFVACGTAKFDPVTFFGFQEIIEQRGPEEVWEKKFRNFEIKNPAFDITSARYVKALITEKGVFPPTEFAGMMYSKLQLEKHEKDFLSLISLMKK